MKTTLFFQMGEVAPLIEHALSSTERKGTFAQNCDEKFQRIENPVIPPGLIWVKDEGIYLLSNGAMKEGETPKSSGLISYALGYHPEKNSDVWENSRYAVGGDDFAEAIEIDDFFMEHLRRTDGYLYITVDENSFVLGWSPNRKIRG